jgi:hypothetical protein
MSTSVPASSMLILPSYVPLQAEFVDAMRNMASAPDGPATEQGEYFLMALAERRAVSTLQDGDYIIVPLFTLAHHLHMVFFLRVGVLFFLHFFTP